MKQSDIKKIHDLKSRGIPNSEIADMTGVSKATIHRVLNPERAREYREKDNHRRNKARATERTDFSERYGEPSGHIVVSQCPSRIMAGKLMEQIPQDTRSLTARAFGDPLPGRSALDRRRS